MYWGLVSYAGIPVPLDSPLEGLEGQRSPTFHLWNLALIISGLARSLILKTIIYVAIRHMYASHAYVDA